MRLLTLACALAAALPFAAVAQTTIAPGVSYVPPSGVYNQLPGGAVSVSPNALQGMGAGRTGGALPPAMPPAGSDAARQAAPLDGGVMQSVPGNPVSGPSLPADQAQPPTASEQGFGNRQDLERVRREMEDYAARNTPRQRGIVVPAPALRNPVGKDPAAREWLANWDWALQGAGVSDAKIKFEAGRLNRADFEAWASRQMRFRQGDSHLDVMRRPDAPDQGTDQGTAQ